MIFLSPLQGYEFKFKNHTGYLMFTIIVELFSIQSDSFDLSQRIRQNIVNQIDNQKIDLNCTIFFLPINSLFPLFFDIFSE